MRIKLNWCETHKIPLYDEYCPLCGSKGKYIASDIRPVFPEEALLLAVIQEKDPLIYQGHSVWYGSSAYIVDGKKTKVSVTQLKQTDLARASEIRERWDANRDRIDYVSFEEIISTFVLANANHLNAITDEAVGFVQEYRKRYELSDMLVSFSGGKDSTATSHIVRRALGTNRILHIFGDTTLEFPMTLEYKKRFVKNEDNRGVRVITAKNREKNFEELVDVVGPPSRVMRWCCTVFKTGAIQKTISSAFRDKTNILTFQGFRRSESASRSKYERESESPKIAKQTVAAPIIDWSDADVWLYILANHIDFNDAYRLGYTRVGCWCCPNNGGWSEFLAKVFMPDQSRHWREVLVDFAQKIGKPDAEDYVDAGNWKARQGGTGLAAAQKSIVTFAPCATEEDAFNYDLLRPVSEELYELFKPFGYLNFDLGNKRLGEVYVMSKTGEVRLILQGRIGKNRLKVTIKDRRLAGAKSLAAAEGKIQCQLTKYQMCLGCKACESVCRFDALSVKDDGAGGVRYTIDTEKCARCTECVGHFDAGCYMRKVLGIKRT